VEEGYLALVSKDTHPGELDRSFSSPESSGSSNSSHAILGDEERRDPSSKSEA